MLWNSMLMNLLRAFLIALSSILNWIRSNLEYVSGEIRERTLLEDFTEISVKTQALLMDCKIQLIIMKTIEINMKQLLY